jgi:hypothetical protein
MIRWIFLKKTISNLDDLIVVQKLNAMTKSINRSEVQRYISLVKAEEQLHRLSMMYANNRNECGRYSDQRRGEYHSIEENFWAIQSGTQGQPPLLVSFVNESDYDHESCKPSGDFNATLSVQPLNGNTNLTDLQNTQSHSFHKLAISVCAQTSGGSWGGEDIWGRQHVSSEPLADEVKILDVEGLTEDLLMKFIISIVQPELHFNGETPLVNEINELRSNGSIAYTPKNHLWLDLWKYYSEN